MDKRKTIPLKVCRDCSGEGPPSEFVKGRSVCLSCQAVRQKRSRKKRKPVVIDPDAYDDVLKGDGTGLFLASRDGLTQGLKGEFEQALHDVNAAVRLHKARLDAAIKSGDPKSIEESSRALSRAQGQHLSLISRLMDKLSAFDDLAAKAEKAKPVTFYLVNLPKDKSQVNIVPTRQVPAEYWPHKTKEDDEL